MRVEVELPELSANMTEGSLVGWLKAPGDPVRPGDLLCEIETDKSTIELEAEVEGVLVEIRVPAGSEDVAVGTTLCIIEAEGAPAVSQPEASPAAVPTPEPEAKPVAAPSSPPPAAPGEAPAAATPLARRVAAQAGVDLDGLAGTGPGGRILKADVEDARTGATVVRLPTATSPPEVEYESVPHTRMRRVIAERLSAAKSEMPHFYLRIECDVSDLLALRADLNARAPTGEAHYKISVNDIVVKAVASALRRVPAANAAWGDDAVQRFTSVHVAVAVATDGGLVTPVVRDADRKGLREISQEIRELAERARAGRLAPVDYQSGTFSVSNLGMYGIESVFPILNPPQSGILGVGAVAERPVVREGRVEVGHVMTCTLSADHRAVDGAVGAEFLAAVRELLEDPLTLAL
ncbi:MAG: 2-oxo acid dehydrogenase subunit E2 [Proteobacteria bacterium]|nr:2-oxo acid dehydrogenase subunit E2 [Pseudomonadota bacterium]